MGIVSKLFGYFLRYKLGRDLYKHGATMIFRLDGCWGFRLRLDGSMRKYAQHRMALQGDCDG